MKSRPVSFILLALVLVVILPACSSATATPTAAPTQAATMTQTLKPTDTSVPTATLTPSPKPSNTPVPPSATVTLTATPSATPKPTFAGFKVEYAENTYYGLLLTFVIPGIKENYRLDVSGVKYTCNYKPENANHLYCYGRLFEDGTAVKLTFMPLTGSDTPLFVTDYKVAITNLATSQPNTVAGPKEGCPVRGEHVTCETEYRKWGAGFCIVATCADSCGYYYSVNTCPAEMTMEGIYIFQGTPPFPGTPYPTVPGTGSK